MERTYGAQLLGWRVGERLAAVYGDAPRRITGGLVLCDAGVSVSDYCASHVFVAAAVAADPRLAVEHQLFTTVEPIESLLAYAEQPPSLRAHLGDDTWVSTLERATLEAVDAAHLPSLQVELAAHALNLGLAGDAAGIVAVADDLGWHRALRKLRSLVAVMWARRPANHDGVPEALLHPRYRRLAEPPARAETADWVVIDDPMREIGDISEASELDATHRVAWIEQPACTVDVVRY